MWLAFEAFILVVLVLLFFKCPSFAALDIVSSIESSEVLKVIGSTETPLPYFIELALTSFLPYFLEKL